MKKRITAFIITATLCSSFSISAIAEDIPREAAPISATEESIIITENLISDILSEVENGLGYLDAKNKANNRIFNAVINNQTKGYGYGILSAISCNAIFDYRDIYLRPDFYKQAEEQVKGIISDLITEVENGTKDYDTARKEAYIKILQSINPLFNPETLSADFCYWNLPAFDSALFNRARKLLLEAEAKRLTQ